MYFVNAHTHKKTLIDDEITVINIDKDQKRVPEAGYYSAGIHPWFIKAVSIDNDIALITLFASKPNVVAIGECGLDKLSKTSRDIQIKVFEKQIEISEEYNKPLIIHNVRSGSDLLQIRKSFSTKIPWLIHGFNGSNREAELFLQQGCYLSFGRHLFNKYSKAAKVSCFCPLDRILSETDNHDISIKEVVNTLAKIRGTTTDQIKISLYKNFTAFFKITDHAG